MNEPNQIRINELARELEVAAKVIIDYLPEAGVTEKKTHSSSIDVSAAVRVREHFRELTQAEAAAEEKAAKEAAAKGARLKPSAAPVGAVEQTYPNPIDEVPRSELNFEVIGKNLDRGISAAKEFIQDSVVPTAKHVNIKVVEFSKNKIIPNVKDAAAKGFAATKRLIDGRSRETAGKLLAAEREIERLQSELGQLQKGGAKAEQNIEKVILSDLNERDRFQELQSEVERLRQAITKAELNRDKLVRVNRAEIEESWKVHFGRMGFDPQPIRWVAGQHYRDRIAVERTLRDLHDRSNPTTVRGYRGKMSTGEDHLRFKLHGNVDARIYWISSNGRIRVTQISKSNEVHP